MIQDIIVFTIIGATAVAVLASMFKNLRGAKGEVKCGSCNGCTGCDLSDKLETLNK